MPETLMVVHCQGHTYHFEKDQNASDSIYGGPLPCMLRGSFGPAPLHHMATLSAQHVPALGDTRVPLIYGLEYSGCELNYRYDSSSVTVLQISPQESTPDWPYANYPSQLPQLPLKLALTQAESWEDFSRRYPNLPAQQAATLVAIIPAARTMGMSLWGEDGDAEEVCVVCECEIDQKKVRSYNICS